MSRIHRLEQLLDAHGATIHRLAASFEADPHRREDLRQDMALALWRALPRFRGESTLGTWVYRICHNVAVDHVIRERRQPATLARGDETAGDRVGEEGAGPEQRADLDRLMAAIRRLPPADRQLVVLALEGLSYAEISGILGISATNVGARLSRLRRRLRDAGLD